MQSHRLTTPEGTKDYLFNEVTIRNQTGEKLTKLFADNSYSQVITPGVEYLDVFLAKGHGVPTEYMYKLTDENGRLMVLRPDSTTPIARLCATRLKDEPIPMRLYYKQPVYLGSKSMSGKRNETLQAGIELVGCSGVESDLEALTLAAESLFAVSPSGFRLEIGHIGIFNGLIEALGLDRQEEKSELIRGYIEGKNYPALNDMLDNLDKLVKLGESDTASALKQLPGLFGGKEVFAKAAKIFTDKKSKEILSYLEDLYITLKKANPCGEILVDLGIVNLADYYTGIVFKGYLPGCLFEAALSGGRYDNLMGAFGRELGAVGFAVNVDAAAHALTAAKTAKKPLRIALTKGRLEKDTVALFQKLGFDCQNLIDKGRKLILPIENENIEVVLAKAADVITYIENGVCDIGVVGKDTISEQGGSFFEVADLGLGKCRFALAAKKNSDFYGGYAEKTIATKYPNVARQFFKAKGMDVRIVKIEGSVELAPLLSLADAIIDIVETGSTLKENGLEIIEEVAPISARLIVNTVSMKLYKKRIEELVENLTSVCK